MKIPLTLGLVFLIFLEGYSLPFQESFQAQKLLTEFKAVNGDVFFPRAYMQLKQVATEEKDSTAIQQWKTIRKRYRQLIRLAKKLSLDLKPVLEARQNALTAHAPDFADDEFHAAETALQNFAQKVQSGYRYSQKEIQKLVQAYQNAFRVAIRANYLGQALILIQESKDLGATHYFPQWLQELNQLVDEIERLIKQRQIDMAYLATRSQLLQQKAHHLFLITQHLHGFTTQKGAAQLYFQALDQKIDSLASVFHIPVDFTKDYPEILDQLYHAATNLQDSLQTLQQQVKQQTSLIDSLQRENLYLNSVLKTHQYNQSTLRDLQKQVKDARGHMLVKGNTVIIRYSMEYSPGKVEFPPESVSKINTFLQAILSFPHRQFTVMVRLPQRGNPVYLQKLATQRAEYIRAYLRAQVPLKDNQISIKGMVDSTLNFPIIEFIFNLNQ